MALVGPAQGSFARTEFILAAQHFRLRGYVRRTARLPPTTGWSCPPLLRPHCLRFACRGSEVPNRPCRKRNHRRRSAAASCRVRIGNISGSARGPTRRALGSVMSAGCAGGHRSTAEPRCNWRVLKEGRAVLTSCLRRGCTGSVEGIFTGFAGTTMRDIVESSKSALAPRGLDLHRLDRRLNGTEASANFVMVEGLSLTAISSHPFASAPALHRNLCECRSRGLRSHWRARLFQRQARFGTVAVPLPAPFCRSDAQVTAPLRRKELRRYFFTTSRSAHVTHAIHSG